MAIVVPIVTQYNGRGLRQATTEISKAEGVFGKLGSAGKIAAGSLALVGTALAAGAVAGAWSSLKAYSDLNETLNKSKVIFGDAATAIEQFGNTANNALGQTKQQAIDAASNFGVFGQAAGLSGQELATFSTSLVSLSADLASFSNTRPEEAITALGAALRGESEPIRRYGVLLDDATLKARAMEMRIYSGSGALTQQQRVMAAYQEILRQTKNQQGDFSRTSDGLANQLRRLEAAVADTQVAFGKGLANGLTSASDGMEGAIEKAIRMQSAAESLGTTVGVIVQGALDGFVLLKGVITALVVQVYDVMEAFQRLDINVKDFWGEISDAEAEAARNALDLSYAHRHAAAAADILGYELAGSANSATSAANGYVAAGDAAAYYAGAAGSAAAAAAAAGKPLYTGGTPTSGYSQENTNRWIQQTREFARVQKEAAAALRRTGGAGGSAAAGISEADKAAKKAGAAFDVMRDRVEKTVTRLGNMKEALDNAKAALADYATEKSAWITGSLDLAQAIQQQLDYAAKAADLDGQIAAAIAAGDAEGKAKAEAEKAGMGAAVSWSDAFMQQIAAAKGAAQAVDELMKSLNPADVTGNQRLLDALTTLSPEQAQLAANDLVKNGLGPQLAAELSSLDVWANGTALTWAQTFYQPGVDAAQQSYDGIKARLEERLPDLYKLGKKAGRSFMDGYNSIVDALPKDVRVPKSPQLLGASASPSPIVVNVTAGIGNPVQIAHEVQRVLAASQARLGV